MRLFQKEHVFLNDWSTITSAFWVKYPNELQPHVLRVDTLDFQIDEENQQFVCRRLLSLKYQCPKWVQKFFGASPIGFAVEEATCSLKDRKLTLKSCNYTFASFFRVEEECEYSPHPDNPQHTLYKQNATYKVSGLGLPVNRAVENAAVAQAAEKSLLGVSVVERIGTFLAEQQWRECCSTCLLTLEEAAATASKQAQETYRQLRQKMKLRVGGGPENATILSEPRETEMAESARPRGTDTRVSDSAISDSAYAALQTQTKSSESQAPPDRADGIPNVPHFTAESFPTPMQGKIKEAMHKQSLERDSGGGKIGEAMHKQSLERESGGGAGSQFVSSNAISEADCPCRLSTPLGRHPAPTSTWRDLRKQWREAPFSDLRSPATAAAVAAASARPGGIDISLVVRDVAAAAQCQHQQQHNQQSKPKQAMEWRGSQDSSLSACGRGAQGSGNQKHKNLYCRFGLLFSSLGRPPPHG